MSIRQIVKTNVVAIAALGIVALTSAFKAKFATDTYHYTGPDFSVANLQTESNWQIGGSQTALNCGTVNQVDCSMDLPTGLNSGTQLDPAKATVQAGAISGFNRVTAVKDPSNNNIQYSETLGEEP
ncbi:hypothetical protein [Niabella beijingensis]|uniref:hypothetical protein n=1 Tax=Niabella beijingensis TaxID=2872700 RepID=UPI001CBA81D1|nr:hypothetical protein [Niabella beijingensis]MBZ4188954.1 hypothetical protein [Niabella beijingensis]